MKAYNIEHNLAFHNERDSRIWFIGELNRQTSSGSWAMICLYDGNGNESERMFAKTFFHQNNIWSFRNGFTTIFNEETHRPSMIVKFDELERAYDESPKLFLSTAKQMKNLSFAELCKILSFSGDSRSFIGCRVRLYDSIASALSCLLITFVTIPFSTIGVRQNPMIGVAKACAALFIFYLISNVCNILSSNEILPIPLAICLPYATVLLPAYPLYKKCI
jgi:lipopolysaccharide export LptBFGC system permease protein LptF